MNAPFVDAVRELVTRTMRAGGAGSADPRQRELRTVPTAPELTGQRELADGSWQVWWQRVRGATGYEVQINENPGNFKGWRDWEQVREPLVKIRNWSGSERIWLRVRAYTTAAVGPWGNPMPLQKTWRERRQAA